MQKTSEKKMEESVGIDASTTKKYLRVWIARSGTAILYHRRFNVG